MTSLPLTSHRSAFLPGRAAFLLALVLLGAAGYVYSQPPCRESMDAPRPASRAPATANPRTDDRARSERYLPAVAIVGEPFRGALT